MNQREFQRKLKSIHTIERGITPDPAWLSRTRETLLMQASNSLSSQPAPRVFRIREFWRQFVPTEWFRIVHAPALALLAILAIITGGSIVSVSAAEQSLPGDFLYQIKLVSEQTQLIFAKTKSDKLKLKTDFVGRRVQEIQAVAATTNSPAKSERLKVATDTLRRDLDTVNTQLAEVSAGGIDDDSVSLDDVVEAAKLVDKKSTEVIATLKDVKPTLSADAQGQVTEVEVAAVTTGVKAIQVLVDSHNSPNGESAITNDELSQVIQGKVDGLQQQIDSTAQQIIAANSAVEASTSTLLAASSTLLSPVNASSTVTQLSQIKDAQQSLQEAKQLLQENKFSEGTDKLGDAAKSMTAAQIVAITAPTTDPNIPLATVTTTPSLPPVTTTSTPVNATSATSVSATGAAGTATSKSPTTNP